MPVGRKARRQHPHFRQQRLRHQVPEENGRLVISVQVSQALPRAGFCLGPGSCMPESWRGETPWMEGENESLGEGVRW